MWWRGGRTGLFYPLFAYLVSVWWFLLLRSPIYFSVCDFSALARLAAPASVSASWDSKHRRLLNNTIGYNTRILGYVEQKRRVMVVPYCIFHPGRPPPPAHAVCGGPLDPPAFARPPACPSFLACSLLVAPAFACSRLVAPAFACSRLVAPDLACTFLSASPSGAWSRLKRSRLSL